MNPVKSADLQAAMSDTRPTQEQQQPQARNYDNNRIARAIGQADGTFEYRIEGAQRSNNADAVRSASDPWEWVMHQQTKSRLAAHQVTGDSIVKLTGKPEVTIDQAVMMGWLSRPSQGGTTQAAVAPQGVAQEPQGVNHATEQQPQQEPLHPDLQTEAVSREAEEAFSTLNASTSALTRVAAVRELTTDGEISERRMEEAASQMGVEPSQVRTMVDRLRSDLEAQADNVASQLGVDPADVWGWAREHRARELGEAIDRQVTLRNTHGYQKLAKEFVTKLDTINPDMILNAQMADGMKVGRAPTGQVFVTTPDGRTWSWGEALASGIMKLSRV